MRAASGANASLTHKANKCSPVVIILRRFKGLVVEMCLCALSFQQEQHVNRLTKMRKLSSLRPPTARVGVKASG